MDPSISVPYWDYTVDAEALGTDWQSSIVLSDAWFGPVNNSRTGDVLVGKYFGRLPIPRAAAPEHNGWGLVTDSVNNNPSPVLTRDASICGLPTRTRWVRAASPLPNPY